MQETKQRAQNNNRGGGGAVWISLALAVILGLGGYFGTTALMNGREPASTTAPGDDVSAGDLQTESEPPSSGSGANETQPPSAGAESGSGKTPDSGAADGEITGTFWYRSYITNANREPRFVGVRFDGNNAIFYKEGEVTRTTYTITNEPVDNNDANPYMSVDQSIKLTRIVFVPEDPSVWKLPVSDIVGLIELDTSIGFGTEDYPNDPGKGVIIGAILLQTEADVKEEAKAAGLDIDFPQIP